MQLVDENTFMFDSMKDKFIDKEQVKEKFGVYPDKVIDIQSLAGDSSDNVPGVPGIGIKTAAELINEYGNLDNLLKNASNIKQPKRRQTLLDNKENALISKKLVTLKKDVPIEYSIDDFLLKPIDSKKILTFLKDMEFSRLYKKLENDYGLFENIPNDNSAVKNEISLEKIK
jgi:DNA polymerase-1